MWHKDLRQIIKEVLTTYGLYSPEAEELLILTAAAESNMGFYWFQVKGPALGIFQMEPGTHDDIIDNFIRYHEHLRNAWVNMRKAVRPQAKQLVLDLEYAIFMARCHYLRDSAKIPSPQYITIGNESIPDPRWLYELAEYYKRVWNTHLGKATVEDAVTKYCNAVGYPSDVLTASTTDGSRNSSASN